MGERGEFETTKFCNKYFILMKFKKIYKRDIALGSRETEKGVEGNQRKRKFTGCV